jgi:catechol 2,3-dioxygenase-like lactoylglutathione lyase family enzyme
VSARLRRSLQGTESLPCLLVDDLSRAAAYYRDVLGFAQVEILGRPPAAAIARRPEGAVLLQLAPPGPAPYTRRQLAPQSWDAVIYVADIDRVAAQLRERGAREQVGIGISHLSDRTLEVRDAWGNVLAFAAAESGARQALRSGLRGAVPAGVRAGLRDRVLGRLERSHLEEFRAFYDGLPDQCDVFYMFFTRGLLHWMVSAARHIPPETNLVLLGSAIPEDEERFIRETLGRPFHNIRLGVDDNTAWEFLFAVNRHNFGWIDIDCFILGPGLLADLVQIDRDVAVNAVWTYEAAPGVPVGCTHLMFVNVQAAAALRARGREVSPANYDWAGSDIPTLHSRTYCRVLTARQRRLLLEVLPPDEHGRPAPPGEAPFFDTLVAYQVAAAAGGFRTHRVRPLVHRTQATLHSGDGQRAWQQDMTDEVVHVGGVSYYWKFFHQPEFRQLYLAVEHTVLGRCAHELPPYYASRLSQLAAELDFLGLSASDAAGLVQQHLTADRGLSAATVHRLTGRAPETARPL